MLKKFHNQRAIYIGRQYGLDMIGLNAQDVRSHSGLKTKCREQLARVKAVLDVIFGKSPKYLGDPLPIGPS